jgi:hypothetical protein
MTAEANTVDISKPLVIDGSGLNPREMRASIDLDPNPRPHKTHIIEHGHSALGFVCCLHGACAGSDTAGSVPGNGDTCQSWADEMTAEANTVDNVVY